ncbi:hypothetical protein MMC17_003189 [Xylographa soralifera]|nr:hypothetical protein [Xylographa soralifera]
MELRNALAITPGVQYLDSEALPYEDDLVAVCMGLVYIERGSGIIALVHETAQKYCEYFRRVLFPDADEEMSRTCMEYMMLVDRKTALRVTTHGYEDEMGEYPLLQYAVPFWARHALKVEDSSLEPLIVHFIQQETSFFLLLKHMTNAMELSESLSAINATAFKREYYPFLIACGYGLQQIAKSMIAAGINPNGSVEASITPLHLAVCNGHIEIARFLISSGVDIDARGTGVDRPIALAVKKGLLSIVELLIDGHARLDARGEGPWCSILELAILHQHESIVQLLLERGAYVETKDYLERTALSCATSIGNAAIVQLLLDHGADINAINPTGMTALHMAADAGVRTVAEILLDHSAKQAGINILLARDEGGRMPLHYATSREVVELFITRGAEINARDFYRATPLLEAARSKWEDVILALVELGADPRAKNNEQETMLSVLEDCNNIELLEKLLRNGADRGDDGSGRTPLQWTVAFAEMRLARAVSAEQRDRFGRRGSLLGSKNKYGAEITQEIQRGSDINAKDNSGSTSLHLAIRRWIMTPQVHRQSTRLLLKKGANVNEQDNNGNTSLHLAASSGFLKAVQLLIEFGADSHIRNYEGCTALELATNNLRSPSAAQIFASQALYSATSSYDTADDGRDKERENVIELLKRHGCTM